ncbi:MAG: hypothetical protein IJ003_02230 [Candidatus Gastranaerophilales bacterium]|nr:hypothetical protein [Candidatus Gastranaerophilales bacterium]
MIKLKKTQQYILSDNFDIKKQTDSLGDDTSDKDDTSIFFDPATLFKEGITEEDFIKKYQEVMAYLMSDDKNMDLDNNDELFDLSSFTQEQLDEIKEVAKTYFEAVDIDNNGVLSQEEIQDIANNDDDSELFSYDDILLLTEELFPEENEKEIQESEIPPTVKTPSSPSGGGARMNNNSSNTDSSSVSTKANSPQETPKMISKDELNKQLEEAKADLETKQQELDAVNNETDPELVSLKEKEQKAYEAHQQETINLENMTQELTNLTTQITQLDSDILNLENSIATIEQTIANLNAQAGASEDAEAFQSQIQAEQDKLETAKINLENLKSQKETLEAQKETLEIQIAEKNTQIATLLEEYNNAKAEFEAKKAELIDTKTKSVNDATKKVEDLEKQIAEFEAEEAKLDEIFDGTVTGYEMRKYSCNGQSYYAYVPEGIDMNDEIPMAVYFHGYGERGNANNLKNDNMYEALKEMAADPNYKNFKGAFLFVHSTSNACWDDENALASADMMINDFIDNSGYNIDTDNVSLIGFSNGGGGVGLYYNYYSKLKNKKFKINKAVVMAGYFADRGLPLMSSQIPVRVYTGDKDGCKNPHKYRALAREVNISDTDNILLEGAGHGDTPERALFRDGLDGDANGCSDLLEYLFG